MEAIRRRLATDRKLAILLTALTLARLGMVLAYPSLSSARPEWIWSNNDGYDTLAIQWVTSGTFGFEAGVPTALRLPLYPAMIAVCYLLFGAAYPVAVMVVQALLSVATGLLLYRTADQLLGRRPARVTLALFVLNPQANNFVFRCATETLFAFLCIACVRCLVAYLHAKAPGDLYRAAVWLGLSLLARQTLAPLTVVAAALAALWLVARARPAWSDLRALALSLTIVGAVVAPWVARNYRHSGHLPVLQTWVGHPMVQGIHVSENLAGWLRGEVTIPELDREGLSTLGETPAPDEPPTGLRPIAREVVADRRARRAAWTRLLADPLATVARTARNLVITPVLQMTWKSTAVLMIWNWPLLLASAAGALRCGRRCPEVLRRGLPAVAIFGYLLGVHALVWPQARYVLPGLLAFSVFAGMAPPTCGPPRASAPRTRGPYSNHASRSEK